MAKSAGAGAFVSGMYYVEYFGLFEYFGWVKVGNVFVGMVHEWGLNCVVVLDWDVRKFLCVVRNLSSSKKGDYFSSSN